MKKIRAWHFVEKNSAGVPVLGYDATDLEVAPGYVYSIGKRQEPSLCVYGMHASRRALDALLYAPGTVACLVDVWGDVIEGDDKLVGRHREVIAMVHAEMILHRFACWCVRQVWDQLTDDRSQRAVEVKEAWIKGRATDEQLAAARAAAWDVAWATNAARAAAMATEVGLAWALNAPLLAVRHAAEGKARPTAAARDVQNAQLERMLLEAMGRGSMND